MNLDEAHAEMQHLSKLLDDALDYLKRQVKEYSYAEDAYRLAKARAHVASSGTVDERRAAVDLATSVERQRAHLADGMRQAGLEAVRSRRAQISAWQSLLAAHREEVGLARTGPQ